VVHTCDRPPQELTLDLMMETEDIPSDDGWALIDAVLVRERVQYSLDDGGTLVWVFTPTQQAQRRCAAAD
jgi:hypothetical protein